MLTVGDQFPPFRLKAVAPSREFVEIENETHAGGWAVYAFYPKDFTFVCPTEIAAFGDLAGAFAERDAHVFVGSTDSEFVHLAWRESHPHLRDLQIPMLSDIRRDLSEALGILESEEKVCMRATFIVDPEGRIRHASVNDGSVGRNPDEVLRVLDALQTDGLTACGWRKGDAPLQVA